MLETAGTHSIEGLVKLSLVIRLLFARFAALFGVNLPSWPQLGGSLWRRCHDDRKVFSAGNFHTLGRIVEDGKISFESCWLD